MAGTWRVGHHNPRNLYINNQHVAVTVGADIPADNLAHRIVDAMNHGDRVMVCSTCYALVPTSMIDHHDTWHDRIAAVAIESTERIDALDSRRQTYRCP